MFFEQKKKQIVLKYRTFTGKKEYMVLIRKTVFVLGVLSLSLLPGHHEAFAADPSVPVILIPGTTRSKLQNEDGKIAWGNWRSFFRFKKDGFLEIELTSTDPTANKDSLQPAGILKKITLLPKLLNLDSYRSFLRTMKNSGYKIGDIRHPQAGDNFFIFDFDWRLDQVENAVRLAELIEELKKFYGDENQKFNIIAHSSGSYIARYYMLYGGVDYLGDADIQPTYAGAQNINQLFLIAPLHKGTMLAFQILNQGYVPVRFFPFVFEYPAHAAFSSPAFFQLMPPESESFFVAPDGHEVNQSPYDPDNWVKYKWSVFSEEEQKRLTKIMKKKYGDEWEDKLEERNEFLREYLGNVLERTQSLHKALNRPINIPDHMEMTLFIIRHGDTLARAEFSPNPGKLTFRSNATRSYRFEEGDGIVTLSSMMGDYTDENAPSSVFIWEKHSKVASNQELHRELLARLN